jgi:hypothetical protein
MKGAAVVDIIEQNIAGDRLSFDKALKALIKRKAYKSGITLDDLAEAFANERFAAQEIKNILEPWAKLPGFPKMFVSAGSDRKICLAQGPGWVDHDTTLWPVPLKVKFTSSDGLYSDEIDVPITRFITEFGRVCLDMPSWLTSETPCQVEVLPHDARALQYYWVVGYVGWRDSHRQLTKESVSRILQSPEIPHSSRFLLDLKLPHYLRFLHGLSNSESGEVNKHGDEDTVTVDEPNPVSATPAALEDEVAKQASQLSDQSEADSGGEHKIESPVSEVVTSLSDQ